MLPYSQYSTFKTKRIISYYKIDKQWNYKLGLQVLADMDSGHQLVFLANKPFQQLSIV